MSDKINDKFIAKWNQLKEEDTNSCEDNSCINTNTNTNSNKNNNSFESQTKSNVTMSAFNGNSCFRTQLNADSDNSNDKQVLPLICGEVTQTLTDQDLVSKTSDNTSEANVSQRKMPVSQLQELCIKKGLQVPEYRLIRAEGQSHSPLFTIQAIIEGLVVCEGIATTKKLAKHNAAEKALTELKSRPELVSKETKDNVINDFVKLKISASDNCDSSVGTSAQNGCQSLTAKMETNDTKSLVNSRLNAVSVLQEVCAQNGMSLPIYEQLDQLGPCHEPTFWFVCKMESADISAKGSGKTKQIAKRNAAEEVLKILNQKEIVSTNKPKKHKSKVNSINNVNIDAQSEGKHMLEFLEALYNYHDLDHLFETNDNDYCLRLSSIAQKMDCTTDYVTFTEEQSKSNNFKCLLQLKKNIISRRLPIFVSWGNSSTSIDSAMQKAAQKAIIMIKVLKM